MIPRKMDLKQQYFIKNVIINFLLLL